MKRFDELKLAFQLYDMQYDNVYGYTKEHLPYAQYYVLHDFENGLYFGGTWSWLNETFQPVLFYKHQLNKLSSDKELFHNFFLIISTNPHRIEENDQDDIETYEEFIEQYGSRYALIKVESLAKEVRVANDYDWEDIIPLSEIFEECVNSGVYTQ